MIFEISAFKPLCGILYYIVLQQNFCSTFSENFIQRKFTQSFKIAQKIFHLSLIRQLHKFCKYKSSKLTFYGECPDIGKISALSCCQFSEEFQLRMSNYVERFPPGSKSKISKFSQKRILKLRLIHDQVLSKHS